MKLRHLLIAGGLAALIAAPAFADLTYTQGVGTTIFDFTCFTTKHCSAHVPVNSAGTEIATSGAPFRTDPTGTTTQPVSIATMPSTPVTGTFWQATQPVSAASLPLPTGASSSANQTTELASLSAIQTSAASIDTKAGSATPACTGTPCVTTIGNTGQMANVGGVDTKSIKCNLSFVYDASTSGSTQLVALSGATSVYVCGYTILAGGTVNVKLITGTGAACVTGTASITPAYQLTAQAGVVDGSPEYRGLKGASSSALCLNTSAAVAVQAIVYYTQF